ncbi:MAG: hypothetical protein WD315_00690 [Balneolaceae bacterium]
MATSSPKLTDSVELPSGADLSKPLFGAGIAGLIASGVGYFLNPDQFFFSYLISFSFFTTFALASLIFVMIHHITRASWGVALRRIPETFSSNIWVWSIFFLPVIFGMGTLYGWSDPHHVVGDPILEGKVAYLNTTFFILRQVLFFGVWGWLGYRLHKISVGMDQTNDWGQTTLLRKISAPGILIFALTIAFASFDWLMSLDAHWFSTMFGVYFFAMSFQALFAMLLLLVFWMHKRGVLENTIGKAHIYDLGAWFFGFTVFYAYIAFSQFLLIYYANISEEVLWYYHRLEGSWEWIAWGLIIGRFIVPFVLLMNRDWKHNRTMLGFVSVVVLVMHFLEVYWIAMPTLHHHGIAFSWLDVTTLIGLGGIFFGLFFHKLNANRLVPVNDPKLGESLDKHYHQ